MTAMVAHEFNNILTPIINYAQLARSNPQLTDKAIDRAADGGQRASTICEAILNLAGGDLPEPSEISLRELIDSTLDAMARDPRKDGIELTVNIPDDLTLRTWPSRLQQVLLNLLMNARAALLAKPGLRRIEISAEANGDEVTLRVSDNGVGISHEDMAKIFQAFYTTRKEASGQARGHGLGLTICHDIVSEMGGRIDVSSAPKQGAVFTVQIPRTVTTPPIARSA